MTGDVLRQAEPLGVSGDELLVFSSCRSDAEADAPVAVLVDDKPREVLLADEEASVRRVPIVRSCSWKRQADAPRSIEQLCFHRHIMRSGRSPRAIPPAAGQRVLTTSDGANQLGVRVAEVHDTEPVALGIGEDDEVWIVRVPVPIDPLGTELDETLDLSRLLCCRADVQVEVDPGVLLRRRLALL
jgi:hypothetical protein